MGTVYALHSGDGQYRYVGATIQTLIGRLKRHKANLPLEVGSVDRFDDWKLANKTELKIVALEDDIAPEDLGARELLWMQALDATGYQLFNNFDVRYPFGRIGLAHTAEARAKISLAHKESARAAAARQRAHDTIRGVKLPRDRVERARDNRKITMATPEKIESERLRWEAHVPSAAQRLNGVKNYSKWAAENPEKAFEERSKAGKKGVVRANHVRWHVKRNTISPDCTLCQEPHGQVEEELPPE